ncbi:MAG: hypothetical protein V4635_05455 [Bacteroidota bacterium]
MYYRLICFLFLCINARSSFSQNHAQDTIYLMNGSVVGEKIIDTVLGAVTIADPKKPTKKIHYELEQLYMVRFADGFKRYYYVQDTLMNNWFTRDEMWMYMKGENDAHRGFKARGSLIGAGIAGLLGGLTGSFFAPVAPYGYMALSGIPKVRIRAETISHPAYVESDAYILGYERVARQKRKIRSIFGGAIGLVIGYSVYALCHQYYPENIDFGFKK